MTDKTESAHADPKHYFYYVRMPLGTWNMVFKGKPYNEDEEGHKPVACVCITYFPEQDRYVRGISICSPRDTFVKRLARLKAMQYAVQWERSGFRIPKVGDTQRWTTAAVHSQNLRFLIDFIEDETGLKLTDSRFTDIEGHVPDGAELIYDKGRVNMGFDDLTIFEQRLVDDKEPGETVVQAEKEVFKDFLD